MSAFFVAVVLGVMWLVVVLPASRDQAKKGVIYFTADERAAVAAAATEVVNVQTYSRRSFDADFARALRGATGSFVSDLNSQKANLLKTMTDKKIDLSVTVSDLSVESSSRAGVLVLVVASGFAADSTGAKQATGVQRIEVTMVKGTGTQKGQWLMSNLSQVGLS